MTVHEKLRRLRFDASPCNFPRAAVPMLAPVDRHQLSLIRCEGVQLDPTRSLIFLRGRYALHEALRRAGLGPGRLFLAPSYHCPTMVDPALRLGADITLYPLRQDLSVDVPALQTLLLALQPRGGCLLLTHFFGLPQAPEVMLQLQKICEVHQLSLIEDCSHCLALGPDALVEGIGTYGDFAVSSPYKFIPVPEMGLLWRKQGAAFSTANDPKSKTRQHWRQAAVLVRELFAKPGRVDASPKPLPAAAATTLPAREWEEDCAGISAQYLPSDEGCYRLPVSSFVLARTPLAPVVSRRRENFRRWLELCKSLPHLQPLHQQIPDACVPYMFPVLLNNPALHFARLKHAGLPIWRWDDELASSCETASLYRLSLLHLPCHQGLSEAQWEWMSRVLHTCLSPEGATQ